MLKEALQSLPSIFSQGTLNHAEQLEAEGSVLSVRFSEGLVKSRVKGQDGYLHDVHMDLREWPKMPARCSCLQKNNCIHAAATLYALRRKHLPDNKKITDFSEGFTLRQATTVNADEVTWFDEVDDSTSSFFHYRLGIIIEGEPVNIIPLIVDVIRNDPFLMFDHYSDDKPIKLAVGKGRTLVIPFSRIKPLVRLIMQLGTGIGRDNSLVVSKYQWMLLEETVLAQQALKSRWLSHPNTELLRQLMHREAIPLVTLPIGLHATLRPYQHEGLSWLTALREAGYSGILADDMGLGKTIQTLALLLLEKESGRLTSPALIIAPTSLVMNWFLEAQKFTPSLRVLVYHGTSRNMTDFTEYDLVISTYGLVQREKRHFLTCYFYYIILDEAQFIKNARTKTTQMIHQLRGQYRLCLTGTPLENHLGELWSLFHFLLPGFLGEARYFQQHVRKPIEREQDNDVRHQFIKRISPFMLRRTKREVATELPEKTEIIQKIDMGVKQRDLYEGIRITMEKKVRDAIAAQGISESHLILLDALLKLRQVCCDPRLVPLVEARMADGESAKLDMLMTLLSTAVEEGRRVLVFSQFTSMLGLIETRLQEESYEYITLTGKTRNRHALIERFQEGNIPIFLISLKAGGTGLNLTKADTVIHYDPWWNPAVEDQATDRAHRIGQEQPVFVYKLIMSGTLEEVMLDLQQKKRTLYQNILNASPEGMQGLTEHDIQNIFSPYTQDAR